MKRFLILLVLLLVSSVVSAKQCVEYYRYNLSWNVASSTKTDSFLKPYKTEKGYLRIDLFNDKCRKHFKVHRLVAEVFIENPENKPQVNHIDGNKQNNCIDNLEWCTNLENAIHAKKMGLNYVRFVR